MYRVLGQELPDLCWSDSRGLAFLLGYNVSLGLGRERRGVFLWGGAFCFSFRFSLPSSSFSLRCCWQDLVVVRRRVRLSTRSFLSLLSSALLSFSPLLCSLCPGRPSPSSSFSLSLSLSLSSVFLSLACKHFSTDCDPCFLSPPPIAPTDTD